jgi:hypothetical protein
LKRSRDEFGLVKEADRKMVAHPLWERSAGCAAVSDTKQIVRRIAKQLRLSLRSAAPQYRCRANAHAYRKAHEWAAFHSGSRASSVPAGK